MTRASAAEHYDVAIVGGGPAGAATAIGTARLGLRTLLIDRSLDTDFKIGESLPPATRVLLSELGVWNQFLADGHLPCHGNESLWGSDTPHTTDFIRDPHGHGWHLDRLRFDAMLRTAARDAGSDIWNHSELRHLHRADDDTWRLDIQSSRGPEQIQSHTIVDASGRAGRVARALNIPRHHDDHLTCIYALYRQPADAEPDRDSLTRIESAPTGWWYTALLPDTHRVVAFFTDPRTETATATKLPEHFDSLLSETRLFQKFLSTRQYIRVLEPRTTAANSSHLDTCCGSGWLAVGDAATSFDPLSSQGIYTALYHAIQAGESLQQFNTGDPNAPDDYAQRVKSVYHTYLRNRNSYYAVELRWPDRLFWKSRRETHSAVR